MAAPMENVNESLCQTIFQSYVSNNISLKHVFAVCDSNQLLSPLVKGQAFPLRHISTRNFYSRMRAMGGVPEGTIYHWNSLPPDIPGLPTVEQFKAAELAALNMSPLKDENNGSVQDMAKHIHGCLGNTKQRAEGVLLLSALVRQCSTDVFQQNALTWIKLLIQILQGHCLFPVYAASCRVLGEIIQFSKTFSELSREITTSLIPQILPVLIKAPREVISPAISCINQLIRTYPGPVGPFKNKLEAFILEQLDNSAEVEAVHRCYALLPQCGPGGSGGVKHAEAWSVQCNQLMGSLQSTIGELYDGLEWESTSQRWEGVSLDLSPIHFERTDRVTALVARWKTLTNCLVCMLSEEMHTAVKLQADVILQLVYRCLSINVSVALQRPTTERSLLAAYIPDIHCCAVDILKQLILLCRRNLVPHCSEVVGVLCQELVWSQTGNHGYDKPYGALRQCVYDALTTWMKTQDGCSGIVLEETTLVKQILEDCSPFTDTFQLTTESSTTNKVGDVSSKKSRKKRKGYQEISQGISTQRKIHHLSNHELVMAALDALYWLITTAGSEMSGKKVQEIQGFIIQTLILVQQSREFPVPYSGTHCRKGLYRVLQACVLSPHPKAPPPTHCALQLFSTGSLDKSLEVSSVCIEACRLCEVLIHPRAPCLNGPVICENPVYVATLLTGQSANTASSNQTGNGTNESDIEMDSDVDIQINGETNTALESSDTPSRKRKSEAIVNKNEKVDSSKHLKLGFGEGDANGDKINQKKKDKTERDIEDKSSNTGPVETVVIDEESDNDVEFIDGDAIDRIVDKDKPVDNKIGKIVGPAIEEDMNEKNEDSLRDEMTNKPGTSKQQVNEELTGAGVNGDDRNSDEDSFVHVGTPTVDTTEESKPAEEQDEEVLNMMSAFVNAGPDSD